MATMSVNHKGQVTLPKRLREQLGIRPGTRIECIPVADHLELHVKHLPVTEQDSGFGLLKSRRKTAPAHFDAALLLRQP